MPSTASLSGGSTSSSTSGRTPVKKFSLDLDEQLWDSGQEWILIFDNLLKHPRGKSKGCKCDMCVDPASLNSQTTTSWGSSSLHRPARSRSGSSSLNPAEYSNGQKNADNVWGKDLKLLAEALSKQNRRTYFL